MTNINELVFKRELGMSQVCLQVCCSIRTAAIDQSLLFTVLVIL